MSLLNKWLLCKNPLIPKRWRHNYATYHNFNGGKPFKQCVDCGKEK